MKFTEWMREASDDEKKNLICSRIYTLAYEFGKKTKAFFNIDEEDTEEYDGFKVESSKIYANSALTKEIINELINAPGSQYLLHFTEGDTIIEIAFIGEEISSESEELDRSDDDKSSDK